MDLILKDARTEIKNLMPGGILEDEDIRQMVENWVNLDSASINQEISGLLDYSKKEVKKFIKDFIERVENQRRYEEKVAIKKKTEVKHGNIQAAKKLAQSRDMSKVATDRKICYCQCTKHQLVNNCVNCGKIVCESEGEGPCLFCGAWVDRETLYDVASLGGEENIGLGLRYEQALLHRDKLIEFDVNAARRLGVLDERSDWYELSNNTWLNKDQRNYAEQMLEIEKKRAEEIDSKMNVNINLETGEVKIKMNEEDTVFEFGNQTVAVNHFLQDQFSAQQRSGKSFRPFEEDQAQMMDPAQQIEALGSFSFKASELTNVKDKKLYDSLKVKDKKKKDDDFKKPVAPQKPQNEELKFLHNGLSQRLQTENPFDEFREAVEKAILEKSKNKSNQFFGDQDFYKESEDTGMCLSMHQPWASLLVLGFKRFEGREWSTKYRGPLWIHATSQKPEPEVVEQVEAECRRHYADIGEQMPPFPDRYTVGSVVGRVDLVDCLSQEQYHDTVPQKLRENSSSTYLFVCRNPQYLDMPLKMLGQPNIYKMPKELMFGARPLLRKTPYTWWPPKEYRSLVIGQFDIYPNQYQNELLQKVLNTKTLASQPILDKLNQNGCFVVSDFLSIYEQQTIMNEIRSLCVNQPQNFKFVKPQPPTAIELEREETQESLRPFVDKSNCYCIEVSGKDLVPEVLKNTVPYALEMACQGSHFKAYYKRFRFDFYKPDGKTAALEKVVMKQEKRTKKNIMTYFALCLGDSIEIQYKLTDVSFKRVLKSGDVFMIDQNVQDISVGVVRVLPRDAQNKLICREGSLLIQVEKE